MIENDHQFKTTKAKLEQFEQALADLKTLEPPATPNKKLRLQAHIDSRESCVEEFREDIASYEANKRLDWELDRDALVSQIEEFKAEIREYSLKTLKVWVVYQFTGGYYALLGAFLTTEKLIESYPNLQKVEGFSTYTDVNDNGVTATLISLG